VWRLLAAPVCSSCAYTSLQSGTTAKVAHQSYDERQSLCGGPFTGLAVAVLPIAILIRQSTFSKTVLWPTRRRARTYGTWPKQRKQEMRVQTKAINHIEAMTEAVARNRLFALQLDVSPINNWTDVFVYYRRYFVIFLNISVYYIDWLWSARRLVLGWVQSSGKTERCEPVSVRRCGP